MIWTCQSRRILSLLKSVYTPSWDFIPANWQECYRHYMHRFYPGASSECSTPPVWGWHFRNSRRRNEIIELVPSQHEVLEGLVLLRLQIPQKHLIYTDYAAWNDLLEHLPQSEAIPEAKWNRLQPVPDARYHQVTFRAIHPEWIRQVDQINGDSEGNITEYQIIRS